MTDWQNLGGVFNSPPAVVVWSTNRLDIFALGTDDVMYHKSWDGSNWSPSMTDSAEPRRGVQYPGVSLAGEGVTCPPKTLPFIIRVLQFRKGERGMKKSRHSEEKIIAAVKQMEGGRKTGDVAREMGVSAATLYAWKSKYGGMQVNEAKRLRQMEDENRRLKHLVADLSLDREVLKAVIAKNGWSS